MLVLFLSFSSFKTYKCPAGPIFKLGLEFSVGTPSGGEGGRGADALGLSVIWGAHAATCGIQKVAVCGGPWKGQGGTSSLHLACDLGLCGGFWVRATAARAAPQTGRFPQA